MSELSRAKAGQREVVGLVQTDTASGWTSHETSTHALTRCPADSADLPAAPYGRVGTGEPAAMLSVMVDTLSRRPGRMLDAGRIA